MLSVPLTDEWFHQMLAIPMEQMLAYWMVKWLDIQKVPMLDLLDEQLVSWLGMLVLSMVEKLDPESVPLCLGIGILCQWKTHLYSHIASQCVRIVNTI